jgi:FxsC-like protein
LENRSVIDSGSPAERTARELLPKTTQAQIDALRWQLNLPPETSPREAPPATRQSELWSDAQRVGGTCLAKLEELLCRQIDRPAPTYWLYVSCATGTKNTAAYQYFFERLTVKLRARGICRDEDLRHLDLITSPDPIKWESWSLRAMQECRILLCLYTREYFDGSYCGRVWGAFLDRLEAQFGFRSPAGSPPPLIIPILWGPPEENPGILPRVVRSVPVPEFRFDPEYRDKGLFFLQKLTRAKRDGYEQRYDAILEAIAEQVQAEARLHALESDPDIAPLLDISDVFHQAADEPGGSTRYARFVFLVATKQSISYLREAECYGDEPEHWRPYFPSSDEALQSIVVLCARELHKTAYVIRLDGAFLATLRSADRSGEPIIVIADPWTVYTRQFSTFEQDYDSAQLSYSRLLVCWNDKDAETKKEWPKLREILKTRAFPTKYNSVFPQAIRDEVISPEQFRRELTEAILSSQGQSLDEVKDPKVATGHAFLRPSVLGSRPSPQDAPPGSVRVAGTDSGSFISRPQMRGPDGGYPG